MPRQDAALPNPGGAALSPPLCWAPPPIWAGEEAHILASGPSLTREVIDGLWGRNLIAINSTVLSAPFAAVWFFSDPEVLFTRRRSTEPRIARDGTNMIDFAKAFCGLAVTTSRRVAAALPGTIRFIHAPRQNEFPAPGSPAIRGGRSSGQTGIGLAIALGATRIVLHGFDMRIVGGREHHHGEYENNQRNPGVYESHFLPAFAGWNETALRAGVTILNATPGSALKEFPMLDTMEK